MKFRTAALLLSVFIFQVIYGQNNGRISGIVVDANSKNPIEYASVSIAQGDKILNGVITDKKGSFILKGLARGGYRLTIAFVGYDTYTKDSLHITTENNDLNLGKLLLHPSVTSMQSVTVTSRATIVENKIDRIVYNAANDVTAQGGTAIDILKKVPQVTVDIDGNVELQGNPNIRFLINGKPSAVFGNSLADALAAIPASQIKSIEAITVPGAKYSAQGTGGIINIILKDNKLQGMNGAVNLSAGSRLENGSANIYYKHNHFSLGGSVSANQQLRSHTPVQQQRQSFGNLASAYLSQDGYTDLQRHGLQAGSNFEWNISRSSTLSGGFTFFNFGNENVSFISQVQRSYDSTTGTSTVSDASRFSNNKIRSNNVDYSLEYKKEFKKEGESFSISWDGSFDNPLTSYSQQQILKGQTIPYSGRNSTNPGKENDGEIAIDYTLPLTGNALFETGLKGEFSKIYSNADVTVFNPSAATYVHDAAQSYDLLYRRQVYGVYVSTVFSLFHHFLDVKAGMRVEQAYTQIDFPDSDIPKSSIWVPSLILSHKLDETQSIKLSYTKRLERPDFGDVNPFINLSDPYNISTGNLLLKPEIGNNSELGYSKGFGKGGNIYIAIFERINTQDLKMVTTFYPQLKIGDSVYYNVSYSKRQNFGIEYNTGVSISALVPVSAKLNVRTNTSFTHRKNVLTNGEGGLSGIGWRLNLNTSYQFNKNMIAEAFTNYNSAMNSIQGKRPQSLTYTIGFRKQFLNKKGSFGFTATNPFTQYVKQQITATTVNSYSLFTRYVPYRSFGITFSWKFGKIEFKKPKDEDSSYQKDLPQ